MRRWCETEKNAEGTRALWEQAIRDHVTLDPTVGYVAMLVASYADFGTGWNAHPGEASLARSIGRTTRTVRDCLAWLEEHGFLTRKLVGGRLREPRWADVYCLSLPAPLAAEVGLWDDKRDGERWMERGRISNGRPARERLSQATHRKSVATHRKRVAGHRKHVA